MTAPQFVDMSGFQTTNIDWATYRKWSAQVDGISRVAIKATEGVGFTDPHFQLYRQSAIDAGIDVLLLYHFGRPDLGNSASSEANFMRDVVGNVRDSDILALDYEVSSPLATAAWAYEWLVQQEANVGKIPAIYASTSYIQEKLQLNALNHFTLWLANWQYTPNERPACPWPWSQYEYLQYTDRAINIPGIPGTVDANIFLGVNPPMIDLSMPEIAFYFEQAPGNAWKCKLNGYIIGNAILDAYRDYGSNRLKGLYYLGLPVSNESPAGTTKGNTAQDFELGRLGYDTDGSLGGRPGQTKGVYPLHVLPQSDQANIDKAAQSLNTATQIIHDALTALGK